MKLRVMLVSSALGCLVSCAAEESGLRTVAGAASGSLVSPWGGSFVLARQGVSSGVDTDEYLPGGDNLESWTELLSVHRWPAPSDGTARDLCSRLQGRMKGEAGSWLRLIKESPGVCVFSGGFVGDTGKGEQAMLGLAYNDASDRSRIVVIHYAARGAALSDPKGSARLRGWLEKFLHQADTINSGARAVVPR
jgi:hypothetical protein